MTIVGTGVGGTGALTNSGGTAVYGGVVTIGTGGASIGGAGNLTLSGGLGASTNALTKVGADTLILSTSNSSYSGNITISAGTLLVGNGASTGGLGSGNIIDNSTLEFDNPSSTTVSNTISGTGALTQEGTGTITLSGNNSYSGATTINSGATVIAGSISALGTGAGGVTENGILNIGTESLNLSSGSSSYTQASASTLDLTANSSSSYGSISSHSASVLANNTINVTVGGYIPNGAVLSVITPVTSITGFAPTTVTSTSSFVNFVSSITGGDLVLNVDHSSTGFSSVGNNPNARAVGNVLDNETNPSSDLASILNTLEFSSRSQVSAALNTLTPIVDRGVIDSSQASLNSFVGAAFQRAQNVLALASSTTGVSAGDASVLNGLWAKQYGGYQEQGTHDSIEGYNAWNTGTTVGLDHLFMENLTVGASLGYAYGRVNSDANSASTDINSAQGTIYAGYQGTDHPYYVDVAGTVAENWYNGQRTITVDTMNRIADAQYRGTESGVYLEGGYKLTPWNNLQVTPLTSLQYTHLYLNRYNESNAGDLDLNVNSQGYNTLESGLGASISYPVKYGWGSLTPEFHAKWLYDFIDQDMSVTSSFAGGGASFATNGASPARDGVNIGGKLTFDLNNDVSMVGEVDTEMRDQFFGIFGSVSVRYKF